MKKISIFIILSMILFCVGCSDSTKKMYDEYTKTYVYIALPNGECVEGYADDVDRWSEDDIRITINGTVYRTHTMNVVFVYT